MTKYCDRVGRLYHQHGPARRQQCQPL